MKKLICVILVLSLVGLASAWSESESAYHAVASGLWSTAGNWSPAGVPGTTGDARIGEGLIITVDANVAGPAIHLGNLGTTPTNSTSVDPEHGASKGTLVVDGATLSTGTISVGHRNDSTGQLDIINSGIVNVTGSVYFSQDGSGTTDASGSIGDGSQLDVSGEFSVGNKVAAGATSSVDVQGTVTCSTFTMKNAFALAQTNI